MPASGKHEIRLLKNESASNIWRSLELTTQLVNESTGKQEQVSLLPVGGTILRQLTLPDEVQTATGRVVRYSNLESEYVKPRNVDVWLPEHYDSSRKYSVLYMHDGQMLFDSTINWNRQEWGVDETLGRLMADKKIKECIVVGIWNTDKRHQEYFPQKPFESMTAEQRAHVEAELQNLGRTTNAFEPVSDSSLKFLVTELKPLIDQTFSTLTGREDTFIAGSSMGGLISAYAICEYPEVFGGAACLSTHWPGTFSMENNPCPEAFFWYLIKQLPDPATHLLYFDYGDQTLDALYPPLQKRADEIMKSAGFDAGNWQTRFFPGEDHSENAWKRRFGIPALFLLGL